MMNAPEHRSSFNPAVFPQYEKLSRSERLFLRTCCYYPPRPRRVRTLEAMADTEHYIGVFERAFGPQLWDWIAGKDVLDFGCGEGGFTLALGAKGAGHTIGLDTLPDFQIAEAEAHRRGYPITFIGASSETLPDAVTDVVISHDSFEHFEEPEHILDEMVRLTRPGGRILIKFGPPWRNPWGRHMSGTVRRDRPWIHLVVPERTIMRAHSVYHDEPILSERYDQLPGGMNKMTVSRFRKIVARQPGIALETLEAKPLYSKRIVRVLARTPGIGEYFTSSARVICRRTDD